MAYVYTPAPLPRTALMRRPIDPRVPVRIVAAPRLPSRAAARATTATTRVRILGPSQLGIIPVVAAALPSVKSLATKAISSVIAIVDPGKKRDANRKARAQIWGDFALAGSITAARRVLGGSRVQYTPLERSYYQAYWTKIQAAEPKLATQAMTLGPLGIPEPGSDVAPPFIPDEEIANIQREVDFYRNPVALDSGVQTTAGALPATTTTAVVPVKSNANVLLALGLVGAFLAQKR